MERVAQVFSSLEDADRADEQYYANLTEQERLDLLLDLVESYWSLRGKAAEGFERVHHIVELSQS